MCDQLKNLNPFIIEATSTDNMSANLQVFPTIKKLKSWLFGFMEEMWEEKPVQCEEEREFPSLCQSIVPLHLPSNVIQANSPALILSFLNSALATLAAFSVKIFKRIPSSSEDLQLCDKLSIDNPLENFPFILFGLNKLAKF